MMGPNPAGLGWRTGDHGLDGPAAAGPGADRKRPWHPAQDLARVDGAGRPARRAARHRRGLPGLLIGAGIGVWVSSRAFRLVGTWPYLVILVATMFGAILFGVPIIAALLSRMGY